MIDKVDLRVPGYVPYSPSFSLLYQELRNDPKGPFRPSQHYSASADLRKYGHPAILHTHCTRDKKGNHKLELLDTGVMGYSQMRNEIQRIFDTPPGHLQVMRVDLAADVEGVPVQWFEKNVAITFKRWTNGIGVADPDDLQFSKMGKSGIETCNFGRRPNFIRVYNKIAELKKQYDTLKRRAKYEQGHLRGFPSFKDMYGYAAMGFILTRVERQIGGGRVPELLSTFADLRQAADFDPFDRIVFLNAGTVEPSPDDYEFSAYAIGMFLRRSVEEQGFHRTKQFVNRHSKRNGKRILKRYHDFLPDTEGLLDSHKLLDIFQKSVSKQLAA
jgi:hypothetical protein